jgi:hypothetical protein
MNNSTKVEYTFNTPNGTFTDTISPELFLHLAETQEDIDLVSELMVGACEIMYGDSSAFSTMSPDDIKLEILERLDKYENRM